MKILVIRFSSIGDIVLTTPVIRCLHQQVPGASIHLLTKKSFYPVTEANPYIDKAWLLTDDNMPALLEELKAEKFDEIIDLHHNLRTLRVKRALKTKTRSFDKLNVEKWLLTNFKVNRLPDIHIVDRYMETVSHLGVYNDGNGLDYFIPPQHHIKESDIPHGHLAGYLALVIGAAHATKRLPNEKLLDLCKAINYPIILLGGKEDAGNGSEIARQAGDHVYNACGKFNLHESADLVKRSNLVITHDTGLMHIAAAFGKPVISIWGNTIPGFGMYPYYGNKQVPQRIFEVEGLSCRPCSKIGHDKCPKKHFRCMMHQPINEIAVSATQFLQGGKL